MKKIFLSLLVVATIASCKKSGEDISCDVSLAGIAGSFRITKVVLSVPAIPDQDYTSTYLPDACSQSNIYQLKADGTVVYTENTSCGGNGTGTWSLSGGNITINHSGSGYDFNATPVSGWDCGTLTLAEDFGSGAKLKYSFTKQ